MVRLSKVLWKNSQSSFPTTLNQASLMNAFKRRADNNTVSRVILLAEDHPLNQKVAMLLLDRLGWESHLAMNGLQAVEAASNQQYAAILMDCQMPEMDGFEATKLIRDAEKVLGRRVPIIAVTAMAMSGDRERCLAAGMDDYITKPIDRDLLAEKLEYWTAGITKEPGKVIPIFDAAKSIVDSKEEPVDFAALQAEYGANAAELLTLFSTSTEKLVDELRKAIDKQQAQKISRLAHEVKGAAWAAHAEELAKLALYLETCAAQQNWRTIYSAYCRLHRQFFELKEYVATLSSSPVGASMSSLTTSET